MAPILTMSLKEVLRSVASELVDVPWALIGGMAISARIEPRFTRDIALAVAVSDDNKAEALVNRFLHQGFSVHMLLEQEATGRMATVRLRTPLGEDGPLVDLLFASCGIEPEVVAAAESIEVAAGLVVPVAQLGHLLAMKILARDDERRPQDLVDIRNILNVAPQNEIERARGALSLIVERGYQRDKDLLRELEELRISVSG